MNVNPYNTKDYENKSDRTLGENKPNSNPNKPNLQKAEMNINSLLTKDYRKNDDFVVRINKPNLVRRRRIANERKLNFNKGLQKKRLFSRKWKEKI
jgi:glutamine phosphoribosylpyrophosphate amidotransferase